MLTCCFCFHFKRVSLVSVAFGILMDIGSDFPEIPTLLKSNSCNWVLHLNSKSSLKKKKDDIWMPQPNRNGDGNKICHTVTELDVHLWSVLQGASLTLPPVQGSPPPLAASLVQPFIQSSLAPCSQGTWPPPVTTPSLSHWNITSIPVPLQQALLKWLNLTVYFPRESYKSPIPSFLFNSFTQQIFNEHILLRYWCGTLLSH